MPNAEEEEEIPTMPAVMPEWLKTVSDVFRNGQKAKGEQQQQQPPPQEDDNNDALQHLLVSLPVCDIDCADGALYYRVLSAWCVSWANVPKAPFLAAWFALSASMRRMLLQERMVFVAELDVDCWRRRQNMLLAAAAAAGPRRRGHHAAGHHQ